MFLIWSLEHDAWWRVGRWGYTRVLAEAGRFSAAESAEILKDANLVTVHECAIPVACCGLSAQAIRNADGEPTLDDFRRRRTF